MPDRAGGAASWVAFDKGRRGISYHGAEDHAVVHLDMPVKAGRTHGVTFSTGWNKRPSERDADLLFGGPEIAVRTSSAGRASVEGGDCLRCHAVTHDLVPLCALRTVSWIDRNQWWCKGRLGRLDVAIARLMGKRHGTEGQTNEEDKRQSG
jgi:hypothetical protein